MLAVIETHITAQFISSQKTSQYQNFYIFFVTFFVTAWFFKTV